MLDRIDDPSREEIEAAFLDLMIQGVAITRASLTIPEIRFTPTEAVVAQCLSIARIQKNPLSAYSIEALTGLPRTTVRRVLKSFEDRGLVTRTDTGGKSLYAFTKMQTRTATHRWFIDEVRKTARQLSRGRNGPFVI